MRLHIELEAQEIARTRGLSERRGAAPGAARLRRRGAIQGGGARRARHAVARGSRGRRALRRAHAAPRARLRRRRRTHARPRHRRHHRALQRRVRGAARATPVRRSRAHGGRVERTSGMRARTPARGCRTTSTSCSRTSRTCSTAWACTRTKRGASPAPGDPERVHARRDLAADAARARRRADARPRLSARGGCARRERCRADRIFVLAAPLRRRSLRRSASASRLPGVQTLVIGVMPASFRMPLDYDESGRDGAAHTARGDRTPRSGAIPGPAVAQGGGSHGLYSVAHLAPGRDGGAGEQGAERGDRAAHGGRRVHRADALHDDGRSAARADQRRAAPRAARAARRRRARARDRVRERGGAALRARRAAPARDRAARRARRRAHATRAAVSYGRNRDRDRRRRARDVRRVARSGRHARVGAAIAGPSLRCLAQWRRARVRARDDHRHRAAFRARARARRDARERDGDAQGWRSRGDRRDARACARGR